MTKIIKRTKNRKLCSPKIKQSEQILLNIKNKLISKKVNIINLKNILLHVELILNYIKLTQYRVGQGNENKQLINELFNDAMLSKDVVIYIDDFNANSTLGINATKKISVNPDPNILEIHRLLGAQTRQMLIEDYLMICKINNIKIYNIYIDYCKVVRQGMKDIWFICKNKLLTNNSTLAITFTFRDICGCFKFTKRELLENGYVGEQIEALEIKKPPANEVSETEKYTTLAINKCLSYYNYNYNIVLVKIYNNVITLIYNVYEIN